MDKNIWIFIAIALVIGLIAFFSYYFSKKTVIKRKLKKAAGKKISEFITGDIAKVVGTVEFIGQPLIAPLSNRECAYYYVLVEQKVSSGKSSHWKKIIEEEVAGNFLVKDGRNYAHIDCSTIKSYIVQDKKYSSGFFNDATDNLEQYLDKHGYKSEGFLGFNKTLRYREGILERGELIAVMGKGEWKDGKQLQLSDNYRRVLEISSTADQPVYLSDDPDTVKITYANDVI